MDIFKSFDKYRNLFNDLYYADNKNNNNFYKQIHNASNYDNMLPYLNFIGTDTKELYEKNLKNMSNDWHYRDKKVNYYINNDGYRTKKWKDIDWKKSTVIFGCSQTFGIGLAEDETINYKLEEMIGEPVINMGFSSGSNQLMMINAIKMINTFNYPKTVIFNWTFLDRFVFFEKNNIVNIGHWVLNNKNKNHIRAYSFYNKNKDNMRMNNFYYKEILKTIFKDKSKLIFFSFIPEVADFFECDVIKIVDLARDLQHVGKDTAISASNYIFNKLNDKK